MYLFTFHTKVNIKEYTIINELKTYNCDLFLAMTQNHALTMVKLQFFYPLTKYNFGNGKRTTYIY